MYLVVACNYPDNDIVKTIANHLVSEKLAACVNMLHKNRYISGKA
ncbi:divalent cation tolerance protein CutA [Thalassotalea psychrophila]|uniref:Divalent cation tolerance protein CutA n=1 Tax=Thalassotalea psychrophila TaxID=3065647 RepID=A0ABY9TSR9_9GAMM|nr:divalent cation tolerance protein CutA [Colwelliaceae bacterium SQ149]